MSFHFDTAVWSEPGLRDVNQDRAGYSVDGGLFSCWILADGLGGHGGGELAAHLAVEAALGCFRDQPAADPAPLLDAAQRAVLDGQAAHPMQAQMRTTIVVLIAGGQLAQWGHCGDSRLYYFHDGRIRRQTLDHSVSQSLAAAGRIRPSQIRFHEDRDRLLSSLGAAAQTWKRDISEPSPVEPGDAFLLATDGFWEWVTEIEMEAELVKAPSAQSWLNGMRARIPPPMPENDRDNTSAIAVIVNP